MGGFRGGLGFWGFGVLGFWGLGVWGVWGLQYVCSLFSQFLADLTAADKILGTEVGLLFGSELTCIASALRIHQEAMMERQV